MRFLLDSSSVIAMARAGRLELLRRIVKRAYVTSTVRSELLARDDETAPAIRPALGTWITVLSAKGAPAEYVALGLHPGEASLTAAARKGDVLVIDEKAGRALAQALGLSCMGLLGLLLAAQREGRISKAGALEALDALEHAGFWVAAPLHRRFRDSLSSEEE